MLITVSHSLQLQRRFQTALINRKFLQDVYKAVNYEAPYSDQEKSKILQQVNRLNAGELSSYCSKPVARAIVEFREEHGQYDRVERLLDVDKIEIRNIEKISDKILKPPKQKKVQQQIKTRKVQSEPFESSFIKRMFSKDIVPKPEEITLSSIGHETTFVGVHLTLQGMAFAQKAYDNTLEQWSIFEMPSVRLSSGSTIAGLEKLKYKEIEPTAVNQYFDHNVLHQACLQLDDHLPVADFYILEEPLPLLPKDPYLKSKINLMKLRTTLITILQMRGAAVYSLRPNVLDSLFRLKRGSERISVQEVQEDVFREYNVDIDEDQREMLSEFTSQGREYLILSLLKCVAFHHLCKQTKTKH